MEKENLKEITFALRDLCLGAIREGDSVAVTGHDMPDCDSVISAVMLCRLLGALGVQAAVKFGTRPDPLTERDMKKLGIFEGICFDGFDEHDALVLVDHHQTFYKNRVLACVDHHTTPPEPNFDLNLVRKASSCGRMVFDMACAVDLADDETERLAVYSVYLDTQSTLAPKFVKEDLPWLQESIARLGLDEGELIRAGFCLNSLSEDANDLAMYGYKKYEFNLGGRFGLSTYVQIDPDEEGWQDKIGEILALIEQKRAESGALLWVFLVNMPSVVRSDLYFIREGGVEKIALDRLASRSRDVVPHMKNL